MAQLGTANIPATRLAQLDKAMKPVVLHRIYRARRPGQGPPSTADNDYAFTGTVIIEGFYGKNHHTVYFTEEHYLVILSEYRPDDPPLLRVYTTLDDQSCPIDLRDDIACALNPSV